MLKIPKKILLSSFFPLLLWQITLGVCAFFDLFQISQIPFWWIILPLEIIGVLTILSLMIASWFSYLYHARYGGAKRDKHKLAMLQIEESRIANKASSDAIKIRKKIRNIQKRMKERAEKMSGIKA